MTCARQQLQQMRPVVERVLEQTRARVLGGDTHVPDKVPSVFEPHTEAIRKGKIASEIISFAGVFEITLEAHTR